MFLMSLKCMFIVLQDNMDNDKMSTQHAPVALLIMHKNIVSCFYSACIPHRESSDAPTTDLNSLANST